MTDLEKNNINQVYFQLLNQQKFVLEEMDYSIFERQKPILRSLAKIGNSSVSVFDLCRKEHIFHSSNFGIFLGYDLKQLEGNGLSILESKINQDDYAALMKNGISILKLFFQFSTDEKANYKLINEYRVLNANNIYIRVIEQHQIMELDNKGNIWLTLSIIDISPNQNSDEKFKSQLLNFRTGKIISFSIDPNDAVIHNATLSPRELQILKLVKNGLLSKEISNELSISLHTVNTHRQRILEKLGANNSMEAILFASRLGFF